WIRPLAREVKLTVGEHVDRDDHKKDEDRSTASHLFPTCGKAPSTRWPRETATRNLKPTTARTSACLTTGSICPFRWWCTSSTASCFDAILTHFSSPLPLPTICFGK